jgi:hypothetical protein
MHRQQLLYCADYSAKLESLLSIEMGDSWFIILQNRRSHRAQRNLQCFRAICSFIQGREVLYVLYTLQVAVL